MQENNNFETIISTWRRLSGEQTETAVVSMSGDSPDYQLNKKKEEETDLLMPDKLKPSATIAIASTIAEPHAGDIAGKTNSEENEEFIKKENDESKDEEDKNSSDTKSDKKDDYLENDGLKEKSANPDLDKDKYGDNVDSVYLRAPPPHKARTAMSTQEEEDCGMKCLYYTLQCCDCVLQ